MTTFTSEDRAAAYEPIPFAGLVPVNERNDEMTEQLRVIPNLDELELRLNQLIAQYEQLKVDYTQLKADSNRYIQLWLETKPPKPLTDQQIVELSKLCDMNHIAGLIDFGRAIEAAHGIGE